MRAAKWFRINDAHFSLRFKRQKKKDSSLMNVDFDFV